MSINSIIGFHVFKISLIYLHYIFLRLSLCFRVQSALLLQLSVVQVSCFFPPVTPRSSILKFFLVIYHSSSHWHAKTTRVVFFLSIVLSPCQYGCRFSYLHFVRFPAVNHQDLLHDQKSITAENSFSYWLTLHTSAPYNITRRHTLKYNNILLRLHCDN